MAVGKIYLVITSNMTSAEKITQKYKFESYYKYCFTVVAEDGKTYSLPSEECGSGEIYRFGMDAEGDMELVDGVWYIDGLPFIAHTS